MIEKNELSWNICGFKRFNYFFIVLYLIGIYCQTFLFDFVIVFFMDKMILSKVTCFVMRKKWILLNNMFKSFIVA